MAASILRAVFDLLSHGKRVDVTNKEVLNEVLEWNYRGFEESMWDEINWGQRPLLSWEDVLRTVQRYANRAMQLYQQWQWLTNNGIYDVYWNMVGAILEADDFQVIAKIMSTDYDFNIRDRLAALAPTFQQTLMQIDEMALGGYYNNEFVIEPDSAMVKRALRDTFYHLMMNPQLYVSSVSTTDIPVMISADIPSVLTSKAKQSPTSPAPADNISQRGGHYKRQRVDRE